MTHRAPRGAPGPPRRTWGSRQMIQGSARAARWQPPRPRSREVGPHLGGPDRDLQAEKRQRHRVQGDVDDRRLLTEPVPAARPRKTTRDRANGASFQGGRLLRPSRHRCPSPSRSQTCPVGPSLRPLYSLSSSLSGLLPVGQRDLGSASSCSGPSFRHPGPGAHPGHPEPLPAVGSGSIPVRPRRSSRTRALCCRSVPWRPWDPGKCAGDLVGRACRRSESHKGTERRGTKAYRRGDSLDRPASPPPGSVSTKPPDPGTPASAELGADTLEQPSAGPP